MSPETSCSKMIAQQRFGSMIRDARLKLGFSQSYVSARLGMESDSYLSRVENGRRAPSKLHLKELSNVLCIDHDTLLNAYFEISRSELEGRGQ